METKKVLKLDDLNHGVITDLWQEEWEKTMENIADDNTTAKTPREITIKVKITPSEKRDHAVIKIEARSKLAPQKPNEGMVQLSFNGSRVEAYANNPKQMELEEGVIEANDAFNRKVK